MASPKLASTERRATLLHAGARVAKSVAAILDPDELLRRTVDIIVDEFGFYYAGVFLIDESGQWAVLRAGHGEAGRAMVDEAHKLEVGGHSMIGAATGRREARIALDVGEEAVFFKNPHLPGTRSEMALPLIAGEEVIGALTVQSEEEAAFTQEDIETLQSMADQLAIAIQNARLHRENQLLLRRAERGANLLRAANEVGKRVTSILDLDRLLPRMVDIIVETYGFYYAGVFLLDERGEWAVLRAGHGAAGRSMMDEGHKLEVGGHSMIGAATGRREARIALDVGEEAVFFKNPHLPDTRSEMALPLVVGEKVLGAVTVQSRQEAAFNDEDILTLQTMADHLAVAIHNAYTLRELEEAHAELLRTRTYEALTTATGQAIHWIGNKALPITTTVARMQDDLARDRVDPDSWRDDLDMVQESAQLIVQVKEKLIGPARESQPRPTILSDVVQSAATLAGVPAERLTVEAAPNTPLVRADSTHLARALGNLFENALEANATQVAIRIEPTIDQNYVSLTMRDNGEGMAPEMQNKAWAAFITTKGPGHSGLGLPATLRVITQLDGRISLASRQGEGTTVTILLPSAPASEGDLGSAPGTLLLIDDDDPWATFALRALSDAGKNVARVTEVDGSAEADLVLLDETLRAHPLGEVLDKLAEAGMLDRTVIVAVAVNVERTTGYLQRGVRDVVLKPYTTAELAALLGRPVAS